MLTGPLHTPLPLRLCPLVVSENFSPKSLLLTYFCGGAQMIYGAGGFGEQGEVSGGGCGELHHCIPRCTRSSLSPLWLWAAFVFAEKIINHQHRNQQSPEPQRKNHTVEVRPVKKIVLQKDFVQLLNYEIHWESESQLTIPSSTHMCM